jgi:hypothetical protein
MADTNNEETNGEGEKRPREEEGLENAQTHSEGEIYC